MKDNNNKKMNNQGRNNNHRDVTFVEHISDVIRRNSTIPQAVSGELRIVNGDVEGGIAVYCSNAVYRASVSESTPRPYSTPNLGYVYVPSACSSKDHEKMPADEKDCRACGYSDIDGSCSGPRPFKELKGWGCVGGKSEECKDCTGCCLSVDDDHSELKDQPVPVTSEKTLADLKDAPFAEKVQHDYYNRTLKEELETSEDVLVNTLIALQYLKKFESLEFDNFEVWKNGECCTSDIEHVLTNYFDVNKDDAKAIAFQISDCMGLDIFKVIAKNKKVYIVAGNVETGVEIYDSSTGKNSKAFIMNVLAKK